VSRPQVTLKLATSLDGKIALANGQSEWVTGEKARAQGRRFRGVHDAICIGANTAILDNPQLTTREGDMPDPIRVIFDSRVRLSPQSNLALTARQIPVILFCRDSVEANDNAKALTQLGVKVLPVPSDETGLDVAAALAGLWQFEVRSLIIEGGGKLAASFVKAGVIDRIEWFRAPIILGGDGRDAIGDLGLQSMQSVQALLRVSIQEIGDDIWETYQ